MRTLPLLLLLGGAFWTAGCKKEPPVAPTTSPSPASETKPRDIWSCGQGPTIMVEAQGVLQLLTVDDSGLYWVEKLPEGNRIYSLSKTDRKPFEMTLDKGRVRGLVSDESYVYWFSDFVLMRYSKASASVSVFAELGDSEAIALTADERSLYWISGDRKTLYSLAKIGGSPKVVTTGESLSALFLDAENVYWSSLGSQEKSGVIGKISKAGGKPSKLVDKIESPSSVYVDGTHVYWNSRGELWREPLKGNGKPRKVISGEGNTNITIVNDSIYGVNNEENSLWKMNKTDEKRTTILEVSDIYDIAIFENKIIWTQNSIQSNAKGYIKSICQ